MGRNELMNQVTQYIQNPYVLHWTWLTILSYFIIWLFARLLAHGISKTSRVEEIISKSYRIWATVLSVHLITVLIALSWMLWKLSEQSRLTSDWIYIIPTGILLFADGLLSLNLHNRKEYFSKLRW